MNLVQLKEIVLAGEGEKLEFKTSTGQLTAAGKTLCGFLNNKGGLLLFGIEDNSSIVGQIISDKTKRQLIAELNKITPKVDFDIQYIDIENTNKKVIAIHAISDPEQMPYMYDGRAYWREQSITTFMEQEKYDYILTQRLKLDRKWDRTFAKGFTIDDLDHEEIKKCVIEGIKSQRAPAELIEYSIEKQLQYFQLLLHGELSNATVVLFGKNLNQIFMHCKIKLAKFIGNDPATGFIDEKEYVGNAFSLLHEAESFIRRNMKIGINFENDSITRTDKPDLPMLAVREALVNAICHRDYFKRGTAVMVSMFDDRVEIWNPGKLLPEVTLEELKLPIHTSLHRNELIAKIFYIRKLIEGWGTGTARIVTLCKENGMYEPEFAQRGAGFLVIFKLGFRTDELSAREKAILKILASGQLSVSEIKIRLNQHEQVTIRTLNRDLKHLQELKFVDSVGSGRALVWRII